MPGKMSCPNCHSDMRSRSLYAHFSLKPYRVCPDCQAKYTTDRSSRKRSLVVALIALLTLALSVAGIMIGFPWGLAAFFGSIGLLGYVGYFLSKIEYVEYHD